MTTVNCVIGGDYALNRASLSIPKGDTGVVKFSLFDRNGQEFDNDDVTSATFYVAEGQWHGGSVYAGGDVLFSLDLTSGITRDADLYSLIVTVPASETAQIQNIHNYYELVIGLAGGVEHTVSSGLLLSNRTLRADGY